MFNIEKSIEEKKKFQKEVSELSTRYNRLIIEACTGSGKGLASFLSIEKSKSPDKWLILVPEIQLIENVKNDIDKHDINIKDKIEDIICYASLKKYKDRKLNILMDEGHHSSSDIRLDYLKSIKADQIIVLSATINSEIKSKLRTLGEWYTYQLSLSDAIEKGILPEPDIRIVYKELDDRDSIYPYKFGKKVINLTARKYYDRLSQTVQYWKDKWESDYEQWQYNKFLLSATNRKRWLSEYKTEATKQIIQSINNQRFICFCGSVKQAKELGGKQAIHSKNTKQHNQELIEKFNNSINNSIFSCQMVREGTNLENCPISVICQLDSDIKSAVQMGGRAMRHNSPLIYIIVVKGTKDEEYLNKFTKDINSKYIKEFKL